MNPKEKIAELAAKLSYIQVTLEGVYRPDAKRKDFCDAIAECLDVLDDLDEYAELAAPAIAFDAPPVAKGVN